MSHTRTALSRLEEAFVLLASFWFLGGLYIDGWAHNHIKTLETFFTPWHAAFYSGYLVLSLALVIPVLLRKREAGSWSAAIPTAYGWALIGIPLFAVGGLGDMLWHITFGVEQDIDALLSPTHLLLATSLFLMLSGPLRAWWKSAKPVATFVGQLPMALSAAFMLSLMSFMTQFDHFAVIRAIGSAPLEAWEADMIQSLAISGFLFQTALFMGFIFLLLKRSGTAPGVITLIFTVNLLAMAWMRDGLIVLPAAVLAGAVADVLAQGLFPLKQHRREARIFAFVVPVLYFFCYFAILLLTSTVWWSVHLWMGSIFIVGIIGLLMSFLALPLAEE